MVGSEVIQIPWRWPLHKPAVHHTVCLEVSLQGCRAIELYLLDCRAIELYLFYMRST